MVKIMFDHFNSQMNHQFKFMSMGTLYKTNLDKNVLWETYLNGFENDTDRQHHNCNCCKSFIKNYGNIVTISNGKIITLWDFEAEAPYTNSVKNLQQIVSNSSIQNEFLTHTRYLGTKSNFDVKRDVVWTHLHVFTNKALININKIDTVLNEIKSTRDVYKRSLDEISLDAVNIVLELISQNSLYRGAEFKSKIELFLENKKEYLSLADDNSRELFAWATWRHGAGKIKNTAIGTLLVDISNGVQVDRAVQSFETIVAPLNYKRPTAAVTESMLDSAKKYLDENGLLDSIQRRFARKDDISVNDCIFVDRSADNTSLFDDLKSDLLVNPRSLSKVETVSVDTFINNILPNINKVELLFENDHKTNLMSLIAPSSRDSKNIINWNNGITWDYNGNVADSIKEKVKRAGGNVSGELRISLEWFNKDDLDLHLLEPDSNEIWYLNKRSRFTSGYLDVDMNAGYDTLVRDPVENIIYPYNGKILEGKYEVVIHNYNRRENSNVGFNVEIACKDIIYNFSYTEPLLYMVDLAKFTYSKSKGITHIDSKYKSSELSIKSENVWGIDTNKFHRVNSIMFSPNHWEGESKGNKHLFFIINNVKNPGNARGFFNEMIKTDAHRKALELIGSRLTVQKSDEQLSGLGFSETVRNHVYLKVTGTLNRIIRVEF